MRKADSSSPKVWESQDDYEKDGDDYDEANNTNLESKRASPWRG